MAEIRTALVTGAARRIGRAIAADLAANGFVVAIHCNRSVADAESLAAEIAAAGGTAAIVQADLVDPEQAGGLIRAAVATVGPLGLLVNNASLFEDDSILDFDAAVWDRHFAVHVRAPTILARDFAAQLPTDAQGLVVNMVDQRVLRPTPRTFSYALSKAALWQATQTMAQALAPRIRVNAVAPGPTLPNERQTKDDFAAEVDAILLKRGPALSEFGRTIRYLWETPSITGQMIALDGGQHLAWQTPDVTGMMG